MANTHTHGNTAGVAGTDTVYAATPELMLPTATARVSYFSVFALLSLSAIYSIYHTAALIKVHLNAPLTVPPRALFRAPYKVPLRGP